MSNSLMPMDDRIVVQRVWEEPSIRNARLRLAHKDDETLADQCAVCEIAAPTGEENRRADWIESQFRSLRYAEVHRDSAGNVIAWRPGAEPAAAPVVVCAHLDTVFPRETPVRVKKDGRRFSAPGIGDNGRGLAGMLALARALDAEEVPLAAPVVFVATTGEEGQGDLRGAKHLFGNGARQASAAIILDGAGDERIVHRALASRRYRISYRGPGGHSWSAFGVVNAVHAASACAFRLGSLSIPAEPRTTMSVARIGGGTSINTIPADAWLEVDVRSSGADELCVIDRQVRAVAELVAREENSGRAAASEPLALRIELIGNRPGGETSADHPLVQAAMQATRLIGRDPVLGTASTDANVPISLGIPAIAVGAGGRGGDAHTESEWFENSNGALGLQRALGIIAAAAGLGGASRAVGEPAQPSVLISE